MFCPRETFYPAPQQVQCLAIYLRKNNFSKKNTPLPCIFPAQIPKNNKTYQELDRSICSSRNLPSGEKTSKNVLSEFNL